LRHIFVIILENQAEDNTFGVKMPVPYLSQTASAQGAFLPNYYGTSHYSLGNYVTLLGGQSVTLLNQNDCPTYSPIVGGVVSGSYGQIQGVGCVYPSTTQDLADQLVSAKFTYKGYMEDMGNVAARESATCGQPTATGVDDTQTALPATAGMPADQYAARHNPFVYYMSTISTTCSTNVVPLTMATLAKDLSSVSTTANFTWITPNLCNDGHDVPCKAPGAAGNTNSDYSNENAFLSQYVPLIVRSPAFQQDGLLMITFDESSPAANTTVGTDTTYDGSSCCNESSETDPNTATPGQPGEATLQGITFSGGGSGGGQTGTLLISPFIKPGTVSSVNYNHYATLHTFEDEFALPYLGFAGFPGTTPFGSDIFGTTPTRYTIGL
jgi:hypothetical protein